MVDFRCLYGRFDPAVALEADDPVYVDWLPEVGLTDVKRQLANSVALLRGGQWAHRLFTGQRGGGKTTELKRVADRTKAAGQPCFVSFLDAESSIDIDDANPTDVVLAMLRQLVTDLRAAGIEVDLGGRFSAFLASAREALASLPDAGLDLKVGDPFGLVELSTVLKRQPSARHEVRRLLEGRLPTLYDAVNEELLPAVRAKLAAQGYASLLLIVDELDRIPAGDDRHHRLFWEGRGKLRALDCHVIYTVPIEYATSRALPALESEYGQVLVLPLLPVTADDTSTAGDAAGCVRQVVAARLAACGTTEDELFGSSAALDELIRLSGGHFRSLFLLVRTAIERGDLHAPLGPDQLDRVARELAARYLDPLESAEREVLALVHQTRAKPVDDSLLPRFYDLLRDQYVFAYAAGDKRWCDWNPLLGLSALGPG